MTLGEAALGYAERGWRVFPVHGIEDGRCTCRDTECADAGKHPRTEHGVNDATSNLDIIRAWWQRWPNANIGGATDKQFALDVDPAKGGRESLAQLEAQYGLLPPTWRSETGGGGEHRFFRQPADAPPLGNSEGRLGLGWSAIPTSGSHT